MNRSSYNGCACHINPPCSYCENTCECDNCKDVVDVTEMYENADGCYWCEKCYLEATDNEQKLI